MDSLEQKLEMREAEVVSLRGFYHKVNPAIKDLRLLFKSMSTIPNLTTREKFALNILYEEACNE